MAQKVMIIIHVVSSRHRCPGAPRSGQADIAPWVLHPSGSLSRSHGLTCRRGDGGEGDEVMLGCGRLLVERNWFIARQPSAAEVAESCSGCCAQMAQMMLHHCPR